MMGSDTQMIERLARRMIHTPRGRRNGMLFWAACRVGEAIRNGNIDERCGVAVLSGAALRAGLPASEARGRSPAASEPAHDRTGGVMWGNGRGERDANTEPQEHRASAPVSLHEAISDMATWDETECEFALRGVANQYDMSVTVLRKIIARQRARNERRVKSGGASASVLDASKILEEATKPELIVETANLPAAANAVRDLFSAAGEYYEWGTPAKVISAGDAGLPQIVQLSVEGVVNEVHRLRRPIELLPGSQRQERTLRDRIGRLYLAKKGEWDLPRLAGITTVPILGDDGSIRAAKGFDREMRLYCANVPALEVPQRPTERQARTALHLLRNAVRTFPFADAPRVWDSKLQLELVDLSQPPGLDESTFLAGLNTAVGRPCLPLAPGLMLVGPQRSGSGSGKGLLARAICLIAYGLRLAPFTPVKDRAELEKRISAELLE
jgi:hypothetical protein